jgi:hypothetical protein
VADLRDQINSARRAGYSDSDIADFLKQRDPNIGKALESGYSADEVMQHLAPPPTVMERAVRQTGIAARGAAPGALGATAGGALGAAIGGPPGAAIGALAGSLYVPAADALASAYRGITGRDVKPLSQAISERLPGPRAETSVERMVEAAGSALGGTVPQVAAGQRMAQMAGGAGAIGREVSRVPLTQVLAAPAAGAAAQGTAEATDSPLAGVVAGVATAAIPGLRATKREAAPTEAELKGRSKANYDILQQSGLQLSNSQFRQFANSLPAQLRVSSGYVPAAYPKISAVIGEMVKGGPKDVAELQALRKMIAGAGKSADAQERLISHELLDAFDDYVLNAPPSAIVGGDKTAIKSWNEARADYAKMKKSEIFTDTASKVASLSRQLSSLARNDKRMRVFTADERKAIEAAAKGGKMQDMLNVAGKFTPMTPAAAIFAAVAPYGAAVATAGLTSRELATRLKQRDIGRLSQQMRLGREPSVLESPLANIPIMSARGLLSGQNELIEPVRNRNALTQ